MEKGGYYDALYTRYESQERGGESHRPQFDDETIKSLMLDKSTEADLYHTSPVDWLRGAIALDSNRGASEVLDEELISRLFNGGSVEWDKQVTQAVRDYLRRKGLI